MKKKAFLLTIIRNIFVRPHQRFTLNPPLPSTIWMERSQQKERGDEGTCRKSTKCSGDQLVDEDTRMKLSGEERVRNKHTDSLDSSCSISASESSPTPI